MTAIVAHRGASHDAPENTRAAFRLAWEQGADGIEGDFMLTADGQAVCFHDLDTARLAADTGGRAPFVVKQATLADLQALDVGRWKGEQWRGEQPPTLADVLAMIPPRKKLVIELKDGPEIVEPLAVALAGASVADDDLRIISFHEATLAACRQRLPQLRTHWLSGYRRDAIGAWRPNATEVLAAIQQSRATGFGSLGLPEHFDAAFVETLRDAGIAEFHVWTIDDPDVARFYQRLGAWGITTNRPKFIRDALEI